MEEINQRQKDYSVDLINSAKNCSLYIDQSEITKLGKGHQYNESCVYFNLENKVVTKVKNPFCINGFLKNRMCDCIYLHIIHNIYFPTTNYKLLGITEIDNIAHLVLEQPFILNLRTPTADEINTYLSSIGFNKSGNGYRYTKEVRIGDCNPNNVIIGIDENVYVIDALFKMIFTQ